MKIRAHCQVHRQRPWRRSSCWLTCFLLFTLAAFAQEEIHIAAHSGVRFQPPREPDGSLVANTPRIKASVDLVLVPVTVTDSMERPVTGLDKQNFQIYENKELQEITHISSEDAPISLAVIFDNSGSMENKMGNAREAVVEFFKTANPQDEFLLVGFSDTPELVEDFTQSIEDIQTRVLTAQAKGGTALMDAIYLALSRMRTSRYGRKALLIISDGGDNASRYTEHEIKEIIKEADVQIYAIGLFDPAPNTLEERWGPTVLEEICNVTGGRAYSVDDPNNLRDISAKIGAQLRHQYVLSYHRNHALQDGKWHRLKVRIVLPRGFSHPHVAAKKGYYAPSR